MTDINNLFFELIQVAIGTRICLSHTPSADEWGELYAMAKKQSLVGVCFAGVQRLATSTDSATEQRQEPPEMLYLTWMGMAAKIQQRNEVVNKQCVELQAKLSADGLRSSILKGQAIASMYPEHLRGLRQSGDIDIYVDCGREKAIEYARGLQGDVDWDYKHLHLHIFPETEVEMHYVPEVFLNLWKNRKLQKWFKESEVSSSMFHVAGGLVCPSVEFNLFYILLHTYRHFLYEGVGMRQLMDWYFVLKSRNNDNANHNDNFISLIKQFGMMRFTKGVMWIMKTVFAGHDNTSTGSAQADNDNFFHQIESDEKEGRYILEQVMMGGNFGHHDERLQNEVKGKWSAIIKILRHNLHLLTHYPSDTIWAPIWIVYHKLWKLMNR